MRVRHAEQAMRGIFALQPEHRAGLDIVDYRLSRIRHLLWNGYHEEARRELFGLRHLAGEAVYLNGERLRRSVDRFLWHCDELRGYLANNEAALIDYGSRYREDMPISSSRAEGCVDEIANARMAKSRRMRWSPARRAPRCARTGRGPRRSIGTQHLLPGRGLTAQVFSTPDLSDDEATILDRKKALKWVRERLCD